MKEGETSILYAVLTLDLSGVGVTKATIASYWGGLESRGRVISSKKEESNGGNTNSTVNGEGGIPHVRK